MAKQILIILLLQNLRWEKYLHKDNMSFVVAFVHEVLDMDIVYKQSKINVQDLVTHSLTKREKSDKDELQELLF